jgi:hypothetical protein
MNGQILKKKWSNIIDQSKKFDLEFMIISQSSEHNLQVIFSIIDALNNGESVKDNLKGG